MFENTFYHKTIRSSIVAFGSLFTKITFQRKNSDEEIEQIIKVPIQYSAKEKWVQIIDQNPEGNTGVYTSLPKMGFEIQSYSYDATRKLSRQQKISCETVNDTIRSNTFTPVPYNIDISLYFATKTQEDALQILEQILPHFSPEHTLIVNAISGMNIVQHVPVILNSVSVEDNYEGSFEDRRFIIHTLSFTMKINLYSEISNTGLIKHVDANIPNLSTRYEAEQETRDSEIIESWIEYF